MALCEPGDKILGMSLAHGGHLTHGAKPNFSGKLYDAAQYGLNPDTGEIENRCRVVHIPALADPNIVDPDPLGRAPGESICEEMHPARRYRRIFAATSKFVVAALYQGKPMAAEDELDATADSVP